MKERSSPVRVRFDAIAISTLSLSLSCARARERFFSSGWCVLVWRWWFFFRGLIQNFGVRYLGRYGLGEEEMVGTKCLRYVCVCV